MAEQLYTIPINETFDLRDGCPLCALHDRLEKQNLEYIMGAAMMEPDVRIVTNKLGFCRDHFHKMLKMGNRLSLALMLESHLAAVDELIPEPENRKAGKLGKLKKYDGDTPAAAMLETAKSCFVCARAADAEKKYISNVIYVWKKDPAFREKLKTQPYFCMEHAALLLEEAKKNLSEENYLTFSQDLLTVMRAQLKTVREDVHAFCRSFDHENAAKPLTEEARYSVEHAIAYLSGDFDKDKK